jgi:DNA-directed RNA polymerase subunit H (RpoH/RPB5)
MYISIEEQIRILKKYKVNSLPRIIISDFLDNPKYVLRKENEKVIWGYSSLLGKLRNQ